MSFKDLMVMLRKKRGLSVHEVAQKLQIDEHDVVAWENGERYPDISVLSDLSRLLETTPGDIVSEFDNEEQDSTNKTSIDYSRKHENCGRCFFAVILTIILTILVCTQMISHLWSLPFPLKLVKIAFLLAAISLYIVHKELLCMNTLSVMCLCLITTMYSSELNYPTDSFALYNSVLLVCFAVSIVVLIVGLLSLYRKAFSEISAYYIRICVPTYIIIHITDFAVRKHLSIVATSVDRRYIIIFGITSTLLLFELAVWFRWKAEHK